MNIIYKILAVLIFISCAVFLVHYFGVGEFFQAEQVQALLESYGKAGILLYIVLVAGGSAVGVPRQLLAILSGYVFGLAGFVWLSIGLVLGCSLGFFTTRYFFQDALQKRFGHKLVKVQSFLERNPFLMSIAIRIVPLGNNASTNIVAGLSTIPPLPFVLGSGVGYLPQSIFFTLAGMGVRVDPEWHMALIGALILLACVLGFLMYKNFARYQQEKQCS